MDKKSTASQTRAQSLGALGEKIAARYLQTKGYKILETNYRIREGEIDLICRKDDSIIFVEVKTRTNQAFGWPEEAVDDFKLRKILAAGSHYLRHHDFISGWQVDVISVICDLAARTAKIKHFQNVGS